VSKSLSLEQLRRTEDPKYVREIVTPEGIPLRFTIARPGERAIAFAIDFFVQLFVVSIMGWGLAKAVGGDGSWLTAAFTVLSFIVLTFYFCIFEVRWQGQTWGKRKIGIRVIDARGGQLETRAVLARNLVRELELWTPIRFVVARSTLWPDAPSWAVVVAIAWTLVFLFLPLFNKDRLRVGDIIAGTRVVLQPKVVLLPDLVAESGATMSQRAKAKAAHEFTDAQLSHYGVYELQVLEGVLRTDPTKHGYFDALQTVAQKVRAKIGFVGAVTHDEQFLRDFYAAQRAHLEQKLLLGQRREDKYAARP
jgi:uncharacterized RDD family membrane protein YckC